MFPPIQKRTTAATVAAVAEDLHLMSTLSIELMHLLPSLKRTFPSWARHSVTIEIPGRKSQS
jgi:hypothetical protein